MIRHQFGELPSYSNYKPPKEKESWVRCLLLMLGRQTTNQHTKIEKKQIECFLIGLNEGIATASRHLDTCPETLEQFSDATSIFNYVSRQLLPWLGTEAINSKKTF